MVQSMLISFFLPLKHKWCASWYIWSKQTYIWFIEHSTLDCLSDLSYTIGLSSLSSLWFLSFFHLSPHTVSTLNSLFSLSPSLRSFSMWHLNTHGLLSVTCVYVWHLPCNAFDLFNLCPNFDRTCDSRFWGGRERERGRRGWRKRDTGYVEASKNASVGVWMCVYVCFCCCCCCIGYCFTLSLFLSLSLLSTLVFLPLRNV